LIDPATITRAVLPVYLIILIGMVIRRTRLLPSAADAPLTALGMRVLSPCLILDNMLGNPALRDEGTVVWSIGIGAFGIALGFGVSLLWGRAAGLQKGSGLRTFALATGLQNYGFIAIPVLAAVFPGQGPMGVLFVHNLGVELAMWSLGLMVLSGSWGGFWKHLVNGPILAVFAGLLLVKTGGDAYVPAVLRKAFHDLGLAAVPMWLLLVGTTMADLMFAERPTLRVALNSVLVRLGLLGFLLLALAKWLPVSRELKQVLVVQAAMPSAVFPIVLARNFGGSPAVAIQITVATAAVAIFTIPLVVAWGARWVFGP
jgi:predicted permease